MTTSKSITTILKKKSEIYPENSRIEIAGYYHIIFIEAEDYEYFEELPPPQIDI